MFAVLFGLLGFDASRYSHGFARYFPSLLLLFIFRYFLDIIIFFNAAYLNLFPNSRLQTSILPLASCHSAQAGPCS